MPRDHGQDLAPESQTTPRNAETVHLGDSVAGSKRLDHFRDVFHQVPDFHTPPSWMEWFGARLAARLLFCIVLLVRGFVLAWWSTQPSLAEVAQVLGGQPEADKLLATFTQLRAAHSKWVLDFFQPLVVTTLVPLFTLLAGYAFGSQQRQNNQQG